MNPYDIVENDIDFVNNLNKAPASSLPQSAKVGRKVLLWFKCEYFYSWIDRAFFM